MVSILPIREDVQEKKLGKLAFRLNQLASVQNDFQIEQSMVLTTDCFCDYMENRFLSDDIVKKCVSLLSQFHADKVDVYLSVYIDCLIDDRPKTVSFSYSGIHNAIREFYEGWFDAKPFAQRSVRHLAPSDTYPAILIQPHREHELSTVTINPKTGELMKSGGGGAIVHCSKSDLSEDEENMIKMVDQKSDLPGKIIYITNTSNGRITIRRILDYPLKADYLLNFIISKVKKGAFSKLKAISMIQPENIATFWRLHNTLVAKTIHIGLEAGSSWPAVGQAVFRWSEMSAITESSIYLAEEISPEDIPILEKCIGSVFSHGGMTSHAAVVSRGLKKTCITRSRDLLFDWENKKAYTIQGEVIKEGTRICIEGNKWAIDGRIEQNEEYKAVCSTAIIQNVHNLLQPYFDPQAMKMLPIETQLHISELINAIKKTRWWI